MREGFGEMSFSPHGGVEEGIAVRARVDQHVRGQESGARGNEEGMRAMPVRFDTRSLKKLHDILELPRTIPIPSFTVRSVTSPGRINSNAPLTARTRIVDARPEVDLKSLDLTPHIKRSFKRGVPQERASLLYR